MTDPNELYAELEDALLSLKADIGQGSNQSVMGRQVKRFDRLGNHLKTIEFLLSQIAKLTPEESSEPDTEVVLYHTDYLEFLAQKYNHKGVNP